MIVAFLWVLEACFSWDSPFSNVIESLGSELLTTRKKSLSQVKMKNTLKENFPLSNALLQKDFFFTTYLALIIICNILKNDVKISLKRFIKWTSVCHY